MSNVCKENTELAAVVDHLLSEIVIITTDQLAAFTRRDHAELMRLDRKLEIKIGEKERAIGAYNQHRNSHGC
jgi:hypothetical protein